MSSDYTETIAIRVTEEDKELIERYADNNGMTQSGASRKFLYEGIEKELGENRWWKTSLDEEISLDAGLAVNFQKIITAVVVGIIFGILIGGLL
jgi:hypothetical protein